MFPKYDVIVVGAGHAGCEAAVAAANMGSKVLLATMNMNTIAQMSCNPAMGGVAKGQIVRFGTNRIKNFMKNNNIEIIIRSHESVMEGCEKFGDTNLYTVFSHTGYGGVYKNSAAILHYKKNSNMLNTLCLPFLPNFTKWYNLTILRSKWMPKNNATDKNYFNAKDRPVTPPRQYLPRKN